MADDPPYLRPFVLDVARVEADRQGNLDIYRPRTTDPGANSPVVIFVHGGPLPEQLRPTPRDWPVYIGYASAAASGGVVAVTVDHRLHSFGDYATAADDVRRSVARVRRLEGVDDQRVSLWFFSGGAPLLADWLVEPPSWLRCAAVTYPLLPPLDGVDVPGRFHPINALAGVGAMPLLLTRVGHERPQLAQGVEAFVRAAESKGVRLSIIDVADGQHGFDMLNHDDDSRRAVRAALSWVTTQLTAGVAE